MELSAPDVVSSDYRRPSGTCRCPSPRDDRGRRLDGLSSSFQSGDCCSQTEAGPSSADFDVLCRGVAVDPDARFIQSSISDDWRFDASTPPHLQLSGDFESSGTCSHRRRRRRCGSMRPTDMGVSLSSDLRSHSRTVDAARTPSTSYACPPLDLSSPSTGAKCTAVSAAELVDSPPNVHAGMVTLTLPYTLSNIVSNSPDLVSRGDATLDSSISVVCGPEYDDAGIVKSCAVDLCSPSTGPSPAAELVRLDKSVTDVIQTSSSSVRSKKDVALSSLGIVEKDKICLSDSEVRNRQGNEGVGTVCGLGRGAGNVEVVKNCALSTQFAADADLEADLLSAKLLREFREAIKSAVDSISAGGSAPEDGGFPCHAAPRSNFTSARSFVTVGRVEKFYDDFENGPESLVTMADTRVESGSGSSFRQFRMSNIPTLNGVNRCRRSDDLTTVTHRSAVTQNVLRHRRSLPDANQLRCLSSVTSLPDAVLPARTNIRTRSSLAVDSRMEEDVEVSRRSPRSTQRRSSKSSRTEEETSSPLGNGSSAPSTISRTSASTKSLPATSGAVDEETFERSFGEVPVITIYSAKDLAERMTRIREVLSETSSVWTKRVDALKEIRACFFAGAMTYVDFLCSHLCTIEPCFQICVRDLRSAVVREACITAAFMSRELGKDFGHFAESLLPHLILLIPNSVRVMATSGSTTVRYIIKYTHVPRLIPVITSNLTSKSSVIRKQCFEFLLLMMQLWPTQTLERHVATLQDALKKGICDPDADARLLSRRAFWGFAEHFRAQAESLLVSLDAAKQKQLMGDQPSNSSSSTSINSLGRGGSSALGRGGKASRQATPRSASRGVESSGYGRKQSGAFSARPSLPLIHSYDERSLSVAIGSTARQRKASVPNGSATVGRHASSTNTVDRSRVRTRPSQSQPGSRSSSPSGRLSYITHTQPDVSRRGSASTTTMPGYTRSAVPRSQGSSREASPSRLLGRDRRYSGGQALPPLRQRAARSSRDLLHCEDMEAVMADALHGVSRSQGEGYDSDDVASETSSMCSEGGMRAYGGRAQTEDMTEIISFMSSGVWSDRRDGLYALQQYITNENPMSRSEVKRVSEIFTRMFHDPHGKVFSVFVDALAQFVSVYHAELREWLYICLTRLLSKTGVDMLASVQAKIQKTLDVIRTSFPAGYQFGLLCRFIVDQTQSPNIKMKVKVSMLTYLHGLSLMLEPADLVNSSDVRLAVSRIVTWTTEPKSVEVRKAAQAVLITLYNLNPDEFMLMLSVLPKTFQEGANRILQNHFRNSGTDDTSSQSSVSSLSGNAKRHRMTGGDRYRGDDASDGLERMKPEEVYDSIRRTTADIRHYVKMESNTASPPSQRTSCSVSERRDVSGGGGSGGTAGLYHLPVVRSPERRVQQRHKQSSRAEQLVQDVDMEDDGGEYFYEESSTDKDAVQDILISLSERSESSDVRKSALLSLIKKAREEQPEVWDEYFNAVLLILLETVTDDDGQIRALALRVLAEFLRCHSDRFGQYVEATIVKTLEAHRDAVKEVTRAAEECAMLLARFIAPDRTIQVLLPMIDSEEYPINLAAIKMMTQLIENSSDDAIVDFLPEMSPTLLKGFENTQSSVRKATVVCLVAVYLCVGEELRPYLRELNGSKVKLLNVYIKRALEQRGQGGYTVSETSSPTSAVDNL